MQLNGCKESYFAKASSAFHLQSAVISAVHDRDGWQDVGEKEKEEKKEEGSQTNHAGPFLAQGPGGDSGSIKRASIPPATA